MPLLLLALLACGGEDTDTHYRIGVMESLNGPGETYGTTANQVKQMALDEINAAGGINGRPLEFVVDDSQCSAQGAIAAYRKLTDVDRIKIILGTSCSGAMLGLAPLSEADGTILFSGLASNPDIANAGDYIFGTQLEKPVVANPDALHIAPQSEFSAGTIERQREPVFSPEVSQCLPQPERTRGARLWRGRRDSRADVL